MPVWFFFSTPGCGCGQRPAFPAPSHSRDQSPDANRAAGMPELGRLTFKSDDAAGAASTGVCDVGFRRVTLHRLDRWADRSGRCSSHTGIAIDNSTAFATNQRSTGVPALRGLRSNPLNLSGSCQRRECSMSSVAFVVSVGPLARVSPGVRRVSIVT